jgi:hypothetical protein
MKKIVLAITLFITSLTYSQVNINKNTVDHISTAFKILVDSNTDANQFDLIVKHLYTLTSEKTPIAHSVVIMHDSIDSIISNFYNTPNPSIFNYLRNSKTDSLDIDISSRVESYKTVGGVNVTNNLDVVCFTMFRESKRVMYFVFIINNKKITKIDVVVYPV